MFEELWQELDNQPVVEGITIIDVSGLPESLGRVIKLLMRRGSYTSGDLATELGLTPDQMQMVGEQMVQKGLVMVTVDDASGESVYKARLNSTKGRKLRSNLFGSLEEGSG